MIGLFKKKKRNASAKTATTTTTSTASTLTTTTTSKSTPITTTKSPTVTAPIQPLQTTVTPGTTTNSTATASIPTTTTATPKQDQIEENEYKEDDFGWGDDDDFEGDFFGEGDDDMAGWEGMQNIDEGDMLEAQPIARTVSYQFVYDDDIKSRKDKAIEDACDELAVTPGEAGCILKAYFWNIEKARDAWFENSDKVRKKIGVSRPLKTDDLPKEVQCRTFMCEMVPTEEAFALGCGHWFCNDCWEQHCMAMIDNGGECLYATCPGFICTKKKCKHSSQDNCKCQELIPETLFYKYVKDKTALAKYSKFLRDAFVENSKQIKWCPKPGCEHAVEYANGTVRDIKCKCGFVFCFACGLDAHRPVPCDLAIKFLELDQGDALTTALLKAITKPCPGCKVLIQKNEACIHMTCKKCRHEFCWLCKKNWKGHGGGYYSCAKYNAAKAEGKLDKEAQTLMKNQAFMQKYNTYRTKYNKERKNVQTVCNTIKKVENSEHDASKTKFLVDALEALSSGCRLLQWSHCLTYFLSAGKEKNLFLFQLGDLGPITVKLMALYGNGNHRISSLLELSTREKIVQGGRQIASIVKKCDVESFIEVIQNQADTENEEWACNVCQTVMTKSSQLKCTKCNACKEHGEKTCWACNPRR